MPVRFLATVVSCLLLVIVPAAVQRTAAMADPFDGFDAYVQEVMGDWKVPGLAVGAIKDGKVVLAKGYG